MSRGEEASTGPGGAVPTGLQFLLGLVTPFAYIAFCSLLVRFVPLVWPWQLMLAGYVVLIATIATSLRWPGYAAGALVSSFLIPIAGIVLVVATCGAIGRPW